MYNLVMKFFVTGRSSNIEEIKRTMNQVIEKGHEISLDWTVFPMVKPYKENKDLAGQFAVAQVEGIAASDVYILLAHCDGTGVFAELGAALALAQLHGKLIVYGVSSDIPEAMFHYHPAIVWKETIKDVFADLGI